MIHLYYYTVLSIQIADLNISAQKVYEKFEPQDVGLFSEIDISVATDDCSPGARWW